MDTIKLFGRTYAKYSFELLDICSGLHMAMNGSMDPMTSPERITIVQFIKWRLDIWDKSLDMYKQYDDCIKSLCEATLTEYYTYPRLLQDDLEFALDYNPATDNIASDMLDRAEYKQK